MAANDLVFCETTYGNCVSFVLQFDSKDEIQESCRAKVVVVL